MKVLTVRQPWAQLIAVGAKDVENRNWHTNVRGRIAIHSSAAYRRADIEDACELMRRWIPRFSDRIFKREAENYPTGVILATVEIVDCVTHSDSPGSREITDSSCETRRCWQSRSTPRASLDGGITTFRRISIECYQRSF